MFNRSISLLSLLSIVFVSLFSGATTSLALETEELPDLVVSDIRIENEKVLTIEVLNDSNVDISEDLVGGTYIYIDDMENPEWTYSWSTLSNKAFYKAGQSSVIQPQWLTGEHVVKACVDPNKVVEEANEENNCTTVLLNEGQLKPDLRVSYLEETEENRLNIHLGNLSDQDVDLENGIIYIHFDNLDEPRWAYNWKRIEDKSFLLANGETVLETPIPTQEHQIHVCIDGPNWIDEGNEVNNCYGRYFYPKTDGLDEEVAVITESPNFKELNEGDPTPMPPADEDDEVIEDFSIYENPFPDTNTSTDVSGKAAAELFRRAVIDGYSDGEFKGENIVNRAEAAKFLLLAVYGEVENVDDNNDLIDIPLDAWFTKYVVTANDLNIMNGHPDNSFKPEESVNTAEFLKMLSRAFDLESFEHNYQDLETGAWYNEFAGAAKEYNLFPDRTENLLPAQKLTRYEVATAIYQYLLNR